MPNKIGAYLMSIMHKRRTLIRTVRGFRSGVCDRSDPVLRAVADLDNTIARIASTEGFTEVEVWKKFSAEVDTPEREALQDLADLITRGYPPKDIAVVRALEEARKVLNE